MTKYLLRMSYDGTNYYGFQRLKGHPSIQNELEKALQRVFKQDVEIKGAGRTDKNVHALDQCASFDAPFEIKNDKLIKAINRYLPMDIRITNCEKVSNDFHARFSVKRKIYEYKINIGTYNPLINNYYYQPNYKINLNKIKKASKVFIGVYDFNNFVSGSYSNTISKINDIKIIKKKNVITIRIIGTHFYKYMVRNIVGALMDYNKDKVSINDLMQMLEKPEQKKQLTTISPNGLYLTKIYY